MPRGFKSDRETTKLARSSGWYLPEMDDLSGDLLRDVFRLSDPRSFVSLPKLIKGESDLPKAHLVLYGKEDKARVRAEIFRRNREENGGNNKCWKCGCPLYEIATWNGGPVGEWDHIRNKPGERCDCPENGRVACRACHKPRHPQVQFGRRGNEIRNQESLDA